MTYRYLADPCRNFCIFTMLPLTDPRDGREKLCLSNFTAGGTGILVFVDVATGVGEALSLPSDEGAWALLLWDRSTLLVGSCPQSGSLFRLDLRGRSWAEPLRVEGETYIWNLARGSKGKAYGGTWPGCALLEYDPESHTLTSLGRLSANTKDCYSRTVYGEVGGSLFVDVGYGTPGIVRWDIGTRTAARFGPEGARIKEITEEWICTTRGGESGSGAEQLDLYDARSLKPIPGAGAAGRVGAGAREIERDFADALRIVPAASVRRLSGGRAAAVRGQEIVMLKGAHSAPELLPIPTEPPPTRILTITTDPQGNIWGSSGLGQTIFRYSPSSGAYWNSAAVCNNGGEVYGMCFAEGRLFLSAYGGGDHVVYDPGAKWDQISNTNPRTLESAGPAMCRPEGRSVIGPDGAFWTGWMARYGSYGGGMSRVDAKSGDMRWWNDPVPGQAVGWLEADERSLYLTTSAHANGLPPREGPFHFAVWDPAGKVTFDHRFDAKEIPGRIACAAGLVLVSVGQELRIFDPSRAAWVGFIDLGGRPGCLVTMPGERVAAFAGERLIECDPMSRSSRELCAVPKGVQTAAVAPSGVLYFAEGTHLYAMEG